MSDETPDDFDSAVEEVATQESVTVTRELKKFPLCPKGTHKGKCIKAEPVEQEFQGQKSMGVRLSWELDKPMPLEEGQTEQRMFRVFDTLSLFFGPKARLHKVFKELTNEDVRSLVQEKKFKRNGKDFVQETFKFQAFVGMTAEVTVIHKESKSDPTKVFANVSAYVCDSEVQKANASLCFTDGADA